MQVSSSVSAGYYTSYRTERSVRYGANVSRTEESPVSEKAMENPGFVFGGDCPEVHKVRMSHGGQMPDSNTPMEDFCLAINYATSSTKENPIVEVSMQIGGETITQEINISEVNPRKATQLEMYAFFYHQDMVTGEKNTYQKFSSYVGNAVQNGHFEGNQNNEDFTGKEHDWQKVIISMWEDYSDAGIYSQMQECIKLNETMEKASIQFVDFDNITFVNRTSEVSLTYSGMNVPESIQIVWMEVAGEKMDYTQRYTHLTQVLFRRIEAELAGKDSQDEAGVIDAAIEAVKKALQDLEDIPTETIANNPDTKKEIQELKNYYQVFMQKLEALKEGSAETTEAETEENAEDITVNYREFFAMYMEQIFIKIQNGDTEPIYQIGSQSFTEKEWETFLEKFDSIEEAIQELMKEEQARKEAQETKKEDVFTNDASTLLTTESTSCVYKTADPDDDDIRYITWYTEEGIFCRKAGQIEGYEWSITFENKQQYDKVMEFIGQFPSDWNMRFAAHENFWNDFLNDEIDMEGFMEFINGTNKGVPDYSVTVGNSMYIDKDKMQWAKYTNPLGDRFYTAEEMHQMQMEIIEANQAKLTKLSDSYGEVYKQNHPDYNGEHIFCEYPGGTLYTADEIGRLKWQQFLAEMNMTEEEMQQKREEWRKQMGYPGY